MHIKNHHKSSESVTEKNDFENNEIASSITDQTHVDKILESKNEESGTFITAEQLEDVVDEVFGKFEWYQGWKESRRNSNQ